MQLVVVGGSDAGISAALRALELAPATAVSVVVADAYPNFSICGIPYYVSGEGADWADRAHRTRADLEGTGMRLHLDTTATRIDVGSRRLQVRDSSGVLRWMDYDALVVGTGATPARPPIDGLDGLGPADGVHLLHTMGDTFALTESLERIAPRTALIVGAGYVGLEMAEALGADYVELANTQYYGWSLVNRSQLMPTREQIEHAEKITNEFRARVGNKMKIFFVVPDYFSDRPKKCMNGWGEVFMIVTANGDVLPCHSARVLPGMEFPNVREKGLKWAWEDSPAFNKYRGDSWMKEPCRTCPEKENDLGGCRCQAFLLSGDAESADPVCSLSPNHHLIEQAIIDAQNPVLQAQPIIFRTDKNSKKYASGESKERVEDFHALP